MRGFLMGLLFVACAGTQPPALESSPVADNSTPGDSQKVCNCPADARSARPEAGSAVIPPGFWCAQSRRTAEENPLHVCFSSEGKCQTLRQSSIKSGNLVSTCQERDTAFCFTMTDKEEQRVHWRCYEAMNDCTLLRKKWLGDQPSFRFGRCVLTTPAGAVLRRTATRLP